VEQPPISSTSDNVPKNSDFFIQFLLVPAPGAQACRRKQQRTVGMVSIARRLALFQFAQYSNRAQRHPPVASPLHGRNALP
jgi:hypothetical protein